MSITKIPPIKRQYYIQCLGIVAATAFFFSSNAIAANYCSFTNNTYQSTLNYGGDIEGNLTVPNDTPIGTVVYEETITAPFQSYYCSVDGWIAFILNPALGNVFSGNAFPLGKSGLSFRIYQNDRPIYRDERLAAGDYSFSTRRFKIQIFKSDKPAQNTVSAGYIGVQGASGLDLIKVYLLKPIILNPGSCQTPNVSVDMGDDYELGEFRNAGDTSRNIKFNIRLNQCQENIQNITYSLTATSQVISQQNGVVALNPSSTAKGIGLKLMGEDGKPIVLGTNYKFYGFNTTDKNFDIPLFAAYYRVANSKLEAGTANASVTFTMNYL